MIRWKRWTLVAVAVLIAGCSSTGPDQMMAAGQLLLAAEAEKGLREEFRLWYPEWSGSGPSRGISELDIDRFPDWATEDYDTCIHWTGTFERETFTTNRQSGDPLKTVYHGSAAGWILVNQDLEWHTLEMRIEYDGESFLWIDAWDGP